jgi:hypothetical protein
VGLDPEQNAAEPAPLESSDLVPKRLATFIPSGIPAGHWQLAFFSRVLLLFVSPRRSWNSDPSFARTVQEAIRPNPIVSQVLE